MKLTAALTMTVTAVGSDAVTELWLLDPARQSKARLPREPRHAEHTTGERQSLLFSRFFTLCMLLIRASRVLYVQPRSQSVLPQRAVCCDAAGAHCY